MKFTYPNSMLILCFLTPILGCIHNTATPAASSIEKQTIGTRPKIEYYVDTNADGLFEKIEPEPEPVPFQGQDEFRITLSRNFKYPASAREQGIAGFVVLDILVDELGFVKDVAVKKSLTPECDEVVKTAFITATANGYATLTWDSTFVEYRMDYPFGFYLQ